MVVGTLTVTAKDGTWSFDFERLRITPGPSAHPLRAALGELVVPLAAVADLAWEPARKGGTLRLHPRPGSDPLRQATGGRLPDAADPLRLSVGPDATATAAALAEAVRDARGLAGIGDGPVDTYLVPAPRVPLSFSGEDGVVSFDGERVRIEWGWAADEDKSAGGPRELPLAELEAVEWSAKFVRFRVRGAALGDPDEDPNCAKLWGFKKDVGLSALLAAAVTARLPHPKAPAEPAALPPAPQADQDVVLRRLRELGELRRDGVLTEDEFTAAKHKLLGGL